MNRDQDLNLGSDIPTPEELPLIAKGVFISKLKKSDDHILPTYHKWRDVWQDNLCFTVERLNEEVVWRAMSISMPMYFLDEEAKTEVTHRAYVYGVFLKEQQLGQGQVFPLAEIKWKK